MYTCTWYQDEIFQCLTRRTRRRTPQCSALYYFSAPSVSYWEQLGVIKILDLNYWFQRHWVRWVGLTWHRVPVAPLQLFAVFRMPNHRWQIYASRYIDRSLKSVSFQLFHSSDFDSAVIYEDIFWITLISTLYWKDPEPAEEWVGVLDATREGPICNQFNFFINGFGGTEDCLKLNVYTHDVSFKTN